LILSHGHGCPDAVIVARSAAPGHANDFEIDLDGANDANLCRIAVNALSFVEQ